MDEMGISTEYTGHFEAIVTQKPDADWEELDSMELEVLRSTHFLTSTLMAIGLVVAFLGAMMSLNNPQPDFFGMIFLIIGVTLSLISSIYMIIRKEAPDPGRIPYTGCSAVAAGSVYAGFFLAVDIALVYYFISILLEK